jgi:filamentous hemagglutinin
LIPSSPSPSPHRARAQRLISALLLGILLTSPGGVGLLPSAALAGPIADPFAPVGFAPQILNAPNGVRMIHISAPNAAGLSLNRYQNLDVDPIGLIFNNSLVNGTSQLGGALSANPRFSGQAARVILNEVRNGPGSILAGPVEVFGQSASLIFANLNGITVNGAAFSNSAHVTLTTGAPLWLSAGSLTSDFAAASGFAFDTSIAIARL